ncbi:hypothetical protein C6A85_000000100285, partial [Mycobacterium sp. ITM-2017-0098]
MAADANVINGSAPFESRAEQPAAPESATAPDAAQAPPAQPRAWSLPKSPVTRRHVDQAGRVAVTVLTGLATAIAGLARYGARVVGQIWRAIDGVPPALQLLFACGVLMLLGIVGSIALSGTIGLMCAVVVV